MGLPPTSETCDGLRWEPAAFRFPRNLALTAARREVSRDVRGRDGSRELDEAHAVRSFGFLLFCVSHNGRPLLQRATVEDAAALTFAGVVRYTQTAARAEEAESGRPSGTGERLRPVVITEDFR